MAAKHQIQQHVSAIKGRKKEKTGLALEDFTVTRNSEEKVTAIICPFIDQCPAKQLKKRPVFVLRFTTTDLRVAATRKQVAQTGKEITNKRASIESTVRSVIHPFGGHPFGGHLCKLLVRGQHRITTLMVLSGMMVNIRRITGYLFPEDGSKSIPDGYALC